MYRLDQITKSDWINLLERLCETTPLSQTCGHTSDIFWFNSPAPLTWVHALEFFTYWMLNIQIPDSNPILKSIQRENNMSLQIECWAFTSQIRIEKATNYRIMLRGNDSQSPSDNFLRFGLQSFAVPGVPESPLEELVLIPLCDRFISVLVELGGVICSMRDGTNGRHGDGRVISRLM